MLKRGSAGKEAMIASVSVNRQKRPRTYVQAFAIVSRYRGDYRVIEELGGKGGSIIGSMNPPLIASGKSVGR